MLKNIGRDFLFSNDCGFINGDDGESYRYSDGSGYYDGDDGSEGYIYSDGSGYYHGADGSEGYLYSDGSAYYNGADGTDAYRYSDGSGYYHGADGSEGYRDSDGSGYFNDANGLSFRYDSSGDVCSSDFTSSMVNIALGLGALLLAKHTSKVNEEAQREKDEQLERARIVEEERKIRQSKKKLARKQRNKRIKAFLFNKKNLALEFATADLIGNNVDLVVAEIKDAGFNNFKTVPIKDIHVENADYLGQVDQVFINGQTCIAEGTMIPYDAEIEITFHAKKEIEFPYSTRQMIKRDFNQLVNEFANIGFTEVYTLPLKDLTVGWIRKERAVRRVMIEGIDTIKKGMLIEYDKKITIQYHSFKGR